MRLSGEIADASIIDGLKEFFPGARVAHAYASTEAGVGFAVNDGREGFPSSLLGSRDGVEMKVEDGSLRIRSTRTAHAYVGRNAAALCEPSLTRTSPFRATIITMPLTWVNSNSVHALEAGVAVTIPA